MLSQSEGQKENRAPVSICCNISFLLYKSGLRWCSQSLALLFCSLDPKSPVLLTAPPAPYLQAQALSMILQGVLEHLSGYRQFLGIIHSRLAML